MPRAPPESAIVAGLAAPSGDLLGISAAGSLPATTIALLVGAAAPVAATGDLPRAAVAAGAATAVPSGLAANLVGSVDPTAGSEIKPASSTTTGA